MAKATPFFSRRIVYDDGVILQMKIVVVPTPVRGSAHSLKYSLFYGRAGERILAYDNEAGKGDHVHRGDLPSNYIVTTVEQLVADFLSEVRLLRGGSL
ncbi:MULTISPECIES: DUF6516 family protein [unclassified Methylobacterium]|uniref:toxin-antitoxin system TumE family protein n=1 Tax=unclassified Methylobacterium TaxID=2615210 RepID=UPI001FB90C32|nr:MULTISPECIES: DUF6516 family protein [unclassified Methylobacterium]MCJ2017637.1 DUF6516 family protein [Methylobacterium sp. E-065]